MTDETWMRFEKTGRVADYLRYCSNDRFDNTWECNKYVSEGERADGSECEPDRDGVDSHACRGI